MPVVSPEHGCACQVHDLYECASIRYPRFPELDAGALEPCECICHAERWDEDEDW